MYASHNNLNFILFTNMKKAYIYTLSDPITGEVKYIGKTINEPKIRLYGHLSESKKSSTHKSNWVKSLLSKGLKPIIGILDEVNNDDWEFWEDYWIEQFKTWGIELTNCIDGGKGVSSEFMKKNNPMFNQKAVEKMRNSMMGNQHAKGFKHSEETRKKVSKNNVKFWLGKKRPEIGDKVSEKLSKPILQISKDGKLINKFKSTREAVKETGIDRTGIYNCLKGKQKTSGGFTWIWA